MVLKNLFTGQQWRNRHKNGLMDMGRGEEKVRCMERVTWKPTLPYVRQSMGICCMAQKTQTGALYQPRGLGWGGRWEVQEGGDICTSIHADV